MTIDLWSAKVCILLHHALRNLAETADEQGQRVRTLSIPVPSPSPTLGLTLQYAPLALTENVWHILDVTPSSPADLAGLLPYGDYIVGTPEGAVHGEAGLGELVEDYLGRSLRLYVYNHEYGVTRTVEILPNRGWGGTGALGCVLGYGALHRLPAPLSEPPAGPGETLFETARFSNEEGRPTSRSPSIPYQPSPQQQANDFMVPAAMDLPPPSGRSAPTSLAPPRIAKKTKITGKERSGFDDMFEEGEQKSKEEDSAPSAKAAPPPPPPKSGIGPPPSAKSPSSVTDPAADPQLTEGSQSGEGKDA